LVCHVVDASWPPGDLSPGTFRKASHGWRTAK
jgi:hypothetical protein